MPLVCVFFVLGNLQKIMNLRSFEIFKDNLLMGAFCLLCGVLYEFWTDHNVAFFLALQIYMRIWRIIHCHNLGIHKLRAAIPAILDLLQIEFSPCMEDIHLPYLSKIFAVDVGFLIRVCDASMCRGGYIFRDLAGT